MPWAIVYTVEFSLWAIGLAGVVLLFVSFWVCERFRRPMLVVGIPFYMFVVAVAGIVLIHLFTPRPPRLPPSAGLRLTNISADVTPDDAGLTITIDADLHNDSSRNYHYVEPHLRYWDTGGEQGELFFQVIGSPPHSVRHVSSGGDYKGFDGEQPRVSPVATFYGQ